MTAQISYREKTNALCDMNKIGTANTDAYCVEEQVKDDISMWLY